MRHPLPDACRLPVLHVVPGRLLLAGLIFGFFAFVIAVLALAVWKKGLSWPALLGEIVVLLAAALNSFIRTADGVLQAVGRGLICTVRTRSGSMAATAAVGVVFVCLDA